MSTPDMHGDRMRFLTRQHVAEPSTVCSAGLCLVAGNVVMGTNSASPTVSRIQPAGQKHRAGLPARNFRQVGRTDVEGLPYLAL